MLGEFRVAAAGDEDLRGRREGEVVGEVREEGGTELRPLGVPLERVVGAADGEEIVPVLLAGEVAEGFEKLGLLILW